MKRKIELYIDDALADLSDQSFILYNYALTDLQKPTAVKNSFSQQITLPGTPANDAIFAHLYRSDRTNDGGFNPMTRTPFSIFADTGELLQSGYVKLDKATRTGATHTYTATLYGGLGSFLYGLMYDAEGNTRRLSDMTYYGRVYSGDDYTLTALNLSRTITRSLIAGAWQYIDTEKPNDAAYANPRALNWMPCYNGVGDGFDADHIVVSDSTGSAGIPASLTDKDGNTFTPYNGYGLVELSEQVNEWQVRDLRSYLQRPILNVQTLLDTLSQSTNNGGYSVTWKTRPHDEAHLWLTLKQLTTIDYDSVVTQTIDSATGTFPAVSFCLKWSTQMTSGTLGTLSASYTFTPKIVGAATSSYSLFQSYDRYTNSMTYVDTVSGCIAVQLVGLDSSDNVVANSDVAIFTNSTTNKTAAQNASAAWSARADSRNAFDAAGSPNLTYIAGTFDGYQQTTKTWSGSAGTLTISGSNIYRIELRAGYLSNGTLSDGTTKALAYPSATIVGDQSANVEQLYQLTRSGSASVTISAVRSGLSVGQDKLLNSEHSIADYLLALAKRYGWLITCDEATKAVTIWDRNTFYDTGEDVIDLTDRVDLSHDVSVVPLNMSSLYYTFSPEAVGGKAKDYRDTYTREYGDAKVNTGYEFNSEAVNLIDGIATKQAVPVLDRSRLYSTAYYGQDWYYGWEQLPRTLTYGSGASTYTEDLGPVYPTGWHQYNSGVDFADLTARMQFIDNDGKDAGGEDCLVYLLPRELWVPSGGDATLTYQVTDDFNDMLYLNNYKPCWCCDFDAYSGHTIVVTADGVPRFSTTAADYDNGTTTYGDDLTFALPLEVYDPLGEDYDAERCTYPRYWRSYLSDRLNDDTKVMTCRVDLSGMQVGPELLRRFFYYGGSLWVLNKISNYSLTTYDPTECEFVQVRDTDNYTNGQTIQ